MFQITIVTLLIMKVRVHILGDVHMCVVSCTCKCSANSKLFMSCVLLRSKVLSCTTVLRKASISFSLVVSGNKSSICRMDSKIVDGL